MKPEETLFIDDTPENILVAQQLGMLTYHNLTGARVVDLFEKGKLKEDLDFNVIHS
jgi:FMN phosphatase YigB (HAD superfamily)